ncbi:hypothetical protein SUDANB66_00595 [Streptomyces sp. SudanB66_2053]
MHVDRHDGDGERLEVTTPRQVRSVGCGARGFGCVTRIVGFLVAVGGLNRIRTRTMFGILETEDVVIGVLMLAGGIAAVFTGTRLSRFGRRHTTRLVKDARALEPQSYILYLRPFDLDDELYGIKTIPAVSPILRLRTPYSRTFEEHMVFDLRRKLGPVVAVGRPDERLPLSGARRFYLPLHNWKPTVSDAIRKARLVVLATGTSEGTLWEFTEAVRLLPPERLLVTVFTDEREYDRFRTAAGAAFAARAAGLQGEEARRLAAFRWPAYPPLKKPDTIMRVAGAKGYIVFGRDWTPEFVRVDPTAVRALTLAGRSRAMARRQVNPVMRRIKQGLAQAPAPAPGLIVPTPPPYPPDVAPHAE